MLKIAHFVLIATLAKTIMNRIFEITIPQIIHITIPAYALFAFVGLFCMMLFLYFRVQKIELSFAHFLALIAFMAIGVGIGSKFLFILTKLPDILSDFSIGRTLHIIIISGFVFYGGLLGAIIGLWLFSKVFQVPFLVLADIVAPGFPLFHLWGRIGCFFAGCCYRKEASWGFALQDEPNVLRIPIQLFESFFLLCIFLILIGLEKRVHKGTTLLHTYLFLYSICRFALEFYRGDEVRGIWFGLSTSQWISIGIFIYIIWRYLKNRQAAAVFYSEE